jgi:hypothetical protein
MRILRPRRLSRQRQKLDCGDDDSRSHGYR